jgi:DNA-directed RNA polymerase subunit RPC12/RpoP
MIGMTNQEAINKLHVMKNLIEWDMPLDYQEVVDLAVEALEKQIPKKPMFTKLKYSYDGEITEIKHPECPVCRHRGLYLWDAEITKGDVYCKRCGQRIDLSED